MFADMVQTRWSRAKVLKELKETLPRAADTLTDLMSDWALFGFLTDERLGPGFHHHERIVLGNLLHEIRRRCHQVAGFLRESSSPRTVSQRQEETSSWRSGRSMRRWLARVP